MKQNKIIYVRSLALLRELSEAKCLGSLIRIEEDKFDPACRPVYLFADNENVRAVVKQYIDTYCVDDRSMDDWTTFYAAKFYAAEKDTILTRNFKIVDEIINTGYGVNLCNVFYNGKKTFVFLANDVIKDIKTKGDAESAKRYAEMVKGEKHE